MPDACTEGNRLPMAAHDHNTVLAREYLAWLRDIRGRRPATTYNYAATLDAFLTFVGGRPLTSLSLQDLEAFFLRPRTKTRGPRVAAGTIAREATTLRSLFTFL